ncbi:MAG: cation-translocating P-type ATPase [Microthrixaceae bacterium]|nr:cation-translocating P-type ATPase [Microthrixaceae bacterium]
MGKATPVGAAAHGVHDMADTCCATDSCAGDRAEADDPVSFWAVREVRLATASGALLAAGLLTGVFGAQNAQAVLFLAGLTVGGSTFVPGSVRALVRGRLGVATLMTIAAAGAVLLGELGEAASLAFLFSISEALEGYALARTRRGLRALLALVPERATVVRGDGTVSVDPAQLVPGDVMVIAAGERVPTDGNVRKGSSVIDLSAVTGESAPVEVGTGDEVLAAAINGGGVLHVEASVTTAGSSLARVVHMVEEAQDHKARTQRLAERVARPLVPAVMVVAAVIAVIGSVLGDPEIWINRALVVLVAAAPCAFAISVPVTVVTAVGAASRMGVLVKGGAALEALASVRVVALDKTGTLTNNTPSVIASVPAAGVDDVDPVRVAASLELHSDHPLAACIVAAASVPPKGAEDVETIAGKGIVGRVDGRPARLGRPGFVDTAGMDTSVRDLQARGATVVGVDHDDRLLGVIGVRDEIRPEAASVIERLRSLGIGRIAMLTGDNHVTATALARPLDLDEVHAELLPQDKVRSSGPCRHTVRSRWWVTESTTRRRSPRLMSE